MIEAYLGTEGGGNIDQLAEAPVVSEIRVTNLVAGHHGVPVVRDLTLNVEAGEVVALLGPNGAGKSTTLWTIAGALPIIGGSVEVLGQPVGDRSMSQIARSGLGLVPEDRGLFYELTVMENLRVRRGRRSSGISLDQIFDYLPKLRIWENDDAASCRVASSRCRRSAARSSRTRERS